MIGVLQIESGARGHGVAGELYGLRVVRASADPAGLWGRRRLLRAGRAIRRGGAVRTLVPDGFIQWDLLESCGLLPVDPAPFLRTLSVPMALQVLERQGLAPDRATVALRGRHAGGEMARAAALLGKRVRRLSISAAQGGEELAEWLRDEYGIPVIPAEAEAQAVLRFHPAGTKEEGRTLDLFGNCPDLAGLSLSAPALPDTDRGRLPLLAALWEGGKLGRNGVRIS